MALTVYAGLPGEGGPVRARAYLCSQAAAGRAVLLLVPSSRYAARLRAAIAGACPVGLRITRFDAHVESDWSLKGDGRSVVAGIQREILLERALIAAGVSEAPGRGAVALLGALATRSSASGGTDHGPSTGLSLRLVEALQVYRVALDAADLVEAAEAALLLARCASPADVIGVEGLTSLTPDREALLRGWSSAGSEVVVSLPWQADHAGTQPVDAMVARLLDSGGTIAASAPQLDGRPPELRRIVTHLFSGGPAAPAAGPVRLGVARGDEAEARLIADRVARAMASGVDGDRIAVAFADPGRHVGWLRAAFDDSGIPAAWDVRTPVPQTPLGRSMLRLWSFCTAGMHREDLAAFMRSPFSGVAAERVDRADVHWRARRSEGASLLSETDRARPLIELCSHMAGSPVDATTAKKWKYLADSLLAAAYGHDAPVPGMDGALDAAVHRAFCQHLTSAAGATGVSISATDLWACFAASSVSPAAQEAAGRVSVTSFDGLRGREFDTVVIGGLTAGETPRQGSDDRLEGDAVLGALHALGVTSDPEEQVRAERVAFYLAATAAAGSLTLVRRETDDEGRALRASVFWEEFLDLYRVAGAVDEEHAGVPATDRRGSDDASTTRPGPCVRRGILTDEAVLATFGTIDAVSPGEVERYTACPYRWFVERRLRPRTPDVEVDVMAAGSAAHKALADFYRAWIAQDDRKRVTPHSVVQARIMAGAVAARAVAEAPAPTTLDEEWLLASVVPSVVGLVERDAGFLPDYLPAELEWSFGLSEGDEPVDLGGVRIRGRADRIDVGPEGLIVIDYKRSKAKSHAEIEREGLVQLQLYGIAASMRLGLPVAAGLYRSLSTGTDRGFVSSAVGGSFYGADVVSPDSIGELLERAVETARTAFEGIRAGVIDPSPDAKRCAYCSALAFCPDAVRS